MAFKIKKPTFYSSAFKKLKTGTKSTVGGELGGNSYKTESPFNQIPLQPGENEAIKPATEKDSKQEIINDIEDRIEFIREDIWNQQEGSADVDADETQASKEQTAALKILRGELKRLRPEKKDRPEPTYEGTDEYRTEKEIGGEKEVDKIIKSGEKD